MKIEVLGPGCPRCTALAAGVRAAVTQMGVDAEITKVTDIAEIASRGVMMTPALVVNGEVKLSGQAASVGELTDILTTALAEKERGQ